MIYLDHNATSPYSDSVIKFIQEDMVTKWANPSSEYVEGAVLSDEIKSIRAFIAEELGCSTKGLVFTSGATESINTVLSPENLKKLGIKNIISSPLEHHATLDRLTFLQAEGFHVHFITNNSSGELDLNEIQRKSSDLQNALFSFLFVNNEIGTINPVQEMTKIIHQHGHLIHVDAVQALGKLKFNLDDLDVDFASFSGHKIGAFKGIGFFYASNIKSLSPLLHGGGQERGYRPGTLNYAGIKSLELAMKDAIRWDINKILKYRRNLEEKLLSLGRVRINSQSVKRVCNTVNFSVEGCNSKEVLAQLARKNIFVSTGSACSSGSFEPSHVIRALGFDRNYASSCIRVSISSSITDSEIDAFIFHLRNIIS